jgi:hypothetical protein
MATLTTKIVITWQTATDQGNVDLIAPRAQTLNRQVAQGKTDGNYYQLTDVITQRNYSDEAGANEYGNFLLTATAAFGITSPTFAVSAI